MDIESISLYDLDPGGGLVPDFLSGKGGAADFFTHPPHAFSAALEARKDYPFPRKETAKSLEEYNLHLGAHEKAVRNVRALKGSEAFCVITGQQAGFLGGPVYTAYKIITAIRLAAHLEERFKTPFVPVFWLASEDHDFNEINRAHVLKADGEVGTVRFSWDMEGNPISDLPVTDEIRKTADSYFKSIVPRQHYPLVKELFSIRGEESFCAWVGRIWSHLFSSRGLVVAEPEIFRNQGGGFFREALEKREAVNIALQGVARRIEKRGYKPAFETFPGSHLFTFSSSGRRIRVESAEDHLDRAEKEPRRYSPDALLRPLYADRVLPVAASVLGPGEMNYQAMLKPLYELFRIPQPLLFPRKSFTIVSEAESRRLQRYGISAPDLVRNKVDVEETVRGLLPGGSLASFAEAGRKIKEVFAPLLPEMEATDPAMKKTWENTLAAVLRSMEKLEGRAARALLSKEGLSKKELHTLKSALLPKGRLQERVFPLPYFINRYGPAFIETVMNAGELENFSHHIITMEESDG